jgi:hypothetical protein
VTPVLWAMMEVIKDSSERTAFLLGTLDNRVGLVEFSESMKYPYFDTKFYDLEKRLTALELESGFGPVEA